MRPIAPVLRERGPRSRIRSHPLLLALLVGRFERGWRGSNGTRSGLFRCPLQTAGRTCHVEETINYKRGRYWIVLRGRRCSGAA
jgi:hypothetical protein